jgi:hypothetical protein
MCASWAESSDPSNFSPHPYQRDRQGNMRTGGQGREPSARLRRVVDCCLPSSVRYIGADRRFEGNRGRWPPSGCDSLVGFTA